MPLGLVLRVTDTKQRSASEYRFVQLPVRIGRSPLNDLPLQSPFVSQFHCVVELHGQNLMLRDLGSRNGTLLSTGRPPAHEAVPLGAHNFTFAIATLMFQCRLEHIDPRSVERYEAPDAAGAAPAAAAGGRDFKATMAVSAEAAMAMARIALADRGGGAAQPAAPAGPAPPPPEAQRLYPFYQQYRNGWAHLRYALGETLNAMAPAERAAFIEWTKLNMIGVEGEPEFQQMVTGATAASPMDRDKAKTAALDGLRMLAKIYVPGQALEEKEEDVGRFLGKVRETLGVFLKSFIPLRDGHRTFTSEMNLQRQAKPQGGEMAAAHAVETATDARELARFLLNWKDDLSTGHRAIEGVFADLMIHQLALLNGVMRGVKSIVHELSPEVTEKVYDAGGGKGDAGFALGPYRFRALWNLYKQRYADIDDGDKRTFSLIFGGDFAATYADLVDASAPPEANTGPMNSPTRRG